MGAYTAGGGNPLEASPADTTAGLSVRAGSSAGGAGAAPCDAADVTTALAELGADSECGAGGTSELSPGCFRLGV